MNSLQKVVIIEGCRTPFLRSGTDYMDLMSYQLGGFAIKGLLNKTGIDPKLIDGVIMGNVISNVKTPNLAREAALTAGVPHTTPCRTVSQACISANRAISDACLEIMTGTSDIMIAGGIEHTSDTPIQFPRKMRKKLFQAQRIRTMGDQLKFISSLRLSDFFPEKPAVAEYTTNRIMGVDCDIMAARFEISRVDQDVFAVRSHHLAAQAQAAGHLDKEMVDVMIPPKFKAITTDNGVRGDSELTKIARLKPAFDRKFGTLTAANSSFLTDGASAVMLMSESKAKELGFLPKAEVVDFVFTGQRLEDELLLGPAYAVSQLLMRQKLTLADLDVIEFHEAFAGQILSNLKALASDEYSQKYFGREKALGEIPMEKFNLWGGSLSIGHPFGATGGRLVTTTCNRLAHEKGTYGLLAACAAGAHGHAMLLKNI
ncbi:MAG: acetyl-CoA C-acyltransferase [Flammeovirgaceae bacterium]|jgi:acetyl-CoA acetyltransferase family protein|nr:acetyl-CoA C-acyltransferase [Flammeovirgaceae bacterium]|tara:strand:- start:12878 stop:14164 length:1287 start_codon:yes stop_codon:yes gene_type:complete